MLTRLLSIINGADGPVRMDDLSRRLGVERSALTPMLDLLEQSGLLTEWRQDETAVACGAGACGTSCHGVSGCPFNAATLPRILEIDANA
jgi:DNA-binding IclR family transcriptional regulator